MYTKYIKEIILKCNLSYKEGDQLLSEIEALVSKISSEQYTDGHKMGIEQGKRDLREELSLTPTSSNN